jgi:hypothetical protein
MLGCLCVVALLAQATSVLGIVGVEVDLDEALA